MLICYATKPEWTDENTSLVRNICAELRSTRPADFRYATFLADDQATFYHLPFMDSDVSPFSSSPAFDAFKRDIDQRYARKSERLRLTELGSYNFYAPPGNASG